MVTLDDLLAELPDNSTGAIDASNIRDIVTALWNRQDATDARVSSLEDAADGGGGPAVSGIWQVNPQPGAVPGGQQVTCETGDFATSSWLRFAMQDKTGTDYTQALLTAASLYGQQQSTAGNYVRASVTGVPTTGSGYVQIPVSIDDASGDGSAAWQAAVVVITS